ncbi:hypothetical protein BGW39_000525 [Mortierella sp. 14UC]|nr:hypothetical protein BGW39_000525 [Mortierella sp. 14UC]
MTVTSSAFLDFVIGFAVSLIASIMNAAGLNLLKLDHVRNSALSTERQRNECGRPMWHVGLYLYIASQLAGSTIALNFLKTQWVAPLGSIALIFNFVFAKILVGTQITRQDVYGTVVVMASVVWIVVFGGMNSSGDIEETMTLTDLKMLFARIFFIIYFSILNGIIFAFLGLGMYAYWAISLDDESGQLRKNMKARLTQLLGTNRFARASGLTLEGDEGLAAEARDQRLKKVVAMIFSACGGLLASETLLLAKSGVKLITSTLAGDNQFTDYLSYFILFVLVFTAILQVYCLNTGLKLYDSVLVVPTFYGFYTAFGLINSTIYLDQLGDYEPWVLLLVLIGIGALIYGVKMLSAPKPEPNAIGDPLSSLDNVYDDDDEDSHEMEQRSKHTKAGEAGDKSGSNSNMVGSIGKKPKKMASLKKKKSARRQSHRGMGLDEENADVPSVYGSQRGMLDDEGMSTFSGSSHTTRGRGTSFTSKSSFQSDPFRTPKDNRSIHEGFGAGGHRMSLTHQAPTHVLVDTTEDLNDSDDDVRSVRKQAEVDAVEREKMRRQSVLQSSLNTLTMHEKSRTELSNAGNNSSQQPPRIDTTTTASETASAAGKTSKRDSVRMSTAAAAGVLSPSQFRAHFTNGQLQDDDDEDADGLGDISRSQMSSSVFHSGSGNPGQQQQQQGIRGHSVRWSTGSSKIDQAFEDLNPFKVLKRDSFVGGAPVITASSASVATGAGAGTGVTTSSSVPSSPHPGSSGPRRPNGHGHGRQDSFSGLPSEWDVPGRKKRHSMLFGEAGRSGSSSSLAGGDGTTTPPSGSMSRSNSINNGGSSVSVSTAFGTFSPGEKMIVHDTEVAPSPRTSRIMSSPEIQLGNMAATFAAMGHQQRQMDADDAVEGRFVGQEFSSTVGAGGSAHQRHYFTGTPQQQPTVAGGAATASSSAGLA